MIDRTRVSETERNIHSATVRQPDWQRNGERKGLTEQDRVKEKDWLHKIEATRMTKNAIDRVRVREKFWQLKWQERWRQSGDTGRDSETFLFWLSQGEQRKTAPNWEGKVGSPTSEIYTDNTVRGNTFPYKTKNNNVRYKNKITQQRQKPKQKPDRRTERRLFETKLRDNSTRQMGGQKGSQCRTSKSEWVTQQESENTNLTV